MQAPILTLTMNPALDLSTRTDAVRPGRKLRCGPTRIDPGGGGVNVSRAIRNLGGASEAVLPLGGATGERYRVLLGATGLEPAIVPIDEATRENITIDETSTGEQYRFVLPGPELREQEWRSCLSVLQERLPTGGYLVASGSLPPGVPAEFYGMVADLAADRGVTLVVDAAGPALAGALAKGVFLIKPSREELADLAGADRDLTADEQLSSAREIVADGRAQLVAVTLGADGALLVSDAGALTLPTPQVTVASTVGAGDAFLAGFVLRLAQGGSIEQAFRTAVAAGSATAMSPGTELCQAEDVARLEQQLPVPARVVLPPSGPA